MGFMIPVAEYFEKNEVNMLNDDTEQEESPEGWYARLSAPGYLDCTDWSGPFETEQAAIDHVKEFYEVDDNGDSLEDTNV